MKHGLSYKKAYEAIIFYDCAGFCIKRYPDCKNIDCGFYVALEALRRAMCYKDGEQNERPD